MKRDGKNVGMKKFNVTGLPQVLYIYQKSNERLFDIGCCGPRIYKENVKTKSYYSGSCGNIDYQGESYPHSGHNGTFTPKRILVIQMN